MSDCIETLREEAEAARLKIELIQSKAALAAYNEARVNRALESYYDANNFVDYRDLLYPRGSVGRGYLVPTTLSDRLDGKNLPVFQTEQELAEIRGLARVIANFHHTGVGIIGSLTNYIVGTGFTFEVLGRANSGADPAMVASVKQVVDEFLEENDFVGDLDRELFRRSRVDGEYFLALHHVGGGHVQARTIEPDQVTEPTAKRQLEEWLGYDRVPSSWSFGVHTDEDDVQEPHGYYVQWSPVNTDWDYYPGGKSPVVPAGYENVWVEHTKVNVLRTVKRGLSDFFSTSDSLERARKIIRNLGEGAAIQAAIAWIKEYAGGVPQANALSAALAGADSTVSQQKAGGSSTLHYQQYEPGSIIGLGQNLKFVAPPAWSSNGPNLIGTFEATLRSLAVRWNLPEFMITGSAANNNYASILVSESPFVKFAQAEQHFYSRSFLRVLWRVLRFAFDASRFGGVPWEVLRRQVEIKVTPPDVATRDRDKETTRREVLFRNRVLSPKTWAAEEGLDYKQEQKNWSEIPETSAQRLESACWRNYP